MRIGLVRRVGRVCAAEATGGDLRVWRTGRGNHRVAKTPPLQSGVCGDGIAIPMPAIAASMRISSIPHVPMSPWF